MKYLSKRIQHFPVDLKQVSIHRADSSKGFTLVEVMVSMIMTITFLMVTMQILLSAALLRAKATEYNDAYNWIQEDFEQVLTKAKAYEMQAFPYSAQCNGRTLAQDFIADSSQGLGGGTQSLGTRSFGGSTFNLTREASNQGTIDPSRLLNINYSIAHPNGKVILELDTKVLIYADFNCPKS